MGKSLRLTQRVKVQGNVDLYNVTNSGSVRRRTSGYRRSARSSCERGTPSRVATNAIVFLGRGKSEAHARLETTMGCSSESSPAGSWIPRTVRSATRPSGDVTRKLLPTWRWCFLAKRDRTIAPSAPSPRGVAFDPATQLKWKNLPMVVGSTPEMVSSESPRSTVDERTLETARTPGARASAAAAAGENESQSELVVST